MCRWFSRECKRAGKTIRRYESAANDRVCVLLLLVLEDLALAASL